MSFPTRLGTHADLLGRMLRTCGVDPQRLTEEAGGPGFLVIARACMVCEHTAACRLWLNAAKPGRRHSPPDFCPNAGRLHQATAAGRA